MTDHQASDLVVDIVINNYEYGEFLADAIESARAQSHPEVRIVVVDDGSRDGSADVLDRYEDRVDAIVRKENGGQGSALNAGFECCEGEVVMFLDADDVLLPDAATRVAAAFAADPDLAKLQFRAEVIDVAGNPTGGVKPAAHLPMPDGDLRQAELAHPYDLVWMSTSANAFRVSRLRQVMPIPADEYRICADWYLVHMAALLGRVRSLPEVGAGYRMHGDNNYEPQSSQLDLDHLRRTIVLAQSTSKHLLATAERLDLPHPQRILSLADLANRMISLRLDPDAHPAPGDTRRSLLADARLASRRRDDISVPMKLLFLAWFAAMTAAPRSLARHLALVFLFPERRVIVNRLLGRLHSRRPEQTSATA